MWSVGLDVHQRSSAMCILDENGKVVKQLPVKGPWPEVIGVLKSLGHPFAVCYEASCGYGHLHDQLRPIAQRVVVAYIDDARRFARNKYVGSYFGIVPCQDATGDANRLGHITREGPAVVRKLLIEAAWQGIRHSPHIRAFFERIRNDDPDRRKIALVATAHYLVRVMQAMLRTGEVWRHDVPATEKEAA